MTARAPDPAVETVSAPNPAGDSLRVASTSARTSRIGVKRCYALSPLLAGTQLRRRLGTQRETLPSRALEKVEGKTDSRHSSTREIPNRSHWLTAPARRFASWTMLTKPSDHGATCAELPQSHPPESGSRSQALLSSARDTAQRSSWRAMTKGPKHRSTPGEAMRPGRNISRSDRAPACGTVDSCPTLRPSARDLFRGSGCFALSPCCKSRRRGRRLQ